MGNILDGKIVAAAIDRQMSSETEALMRAGVTPTLAIVRVGERSGDIAYERGAVKRCERVGVTPEKIVLPYDVSQAELLETIRAVNADARIHGCLLFRPLPSHIDEKAVCNALLPEKDVDGITKSSIASVFSDEAAGFPPCTAQACMEILDHFGYNIQGKRAVVAGRSLVIGKPVAMMLLGRNATVTICHSKTEGMADICRSADILIAAVGRARFIKEDFVGRGAVIIDVGINVDADGGITGDVDPAAVRSADAYTPVPGGVGAVTTSVLAKHVVLAAKRQTERS